VPWTLPFAISATNVGEDDPALTVNQLLDRYSDSTGVQWSVTPAGELITEAAPTSPRWGLVVSEGDLWTVDDSSYVTHLNVVYIGTGPVFTDLEVTTSDSVSAASIWGRVEKTLDLTDQGILTAGQAQAYGEAVLGRTGPRLQLTDPITLAMGALRTIGDTVATRWAAVRAGQMIRLWGVPDRSKASPTLHTDMVFGRVERTASTLTLTPYGASTQTFEDIVAELFSTVT
jgi:hypothetical protein